MDLRLIVDDFAEEASVRVTDCLSQIGRSYVVPFTKSR